LQFDIGLGYVATVQRLMAYLRNQIFLDFQGDLDVEKVRELLAGDDSRDAKQLIARLTRDGGTDEMMITLADCLIEVVQTALTEEVIRDQVRSYIEQ
jgi:hypothetical protein